MDDFDFKQIAPRCGGKREAFEELCCQLAHRTVPEKAAYTRLLGAGGDGGVECFADMPDGLRIGWQAKYVFDIDSLLAQATESITTALTIHERLTRYIVCFPFDLTGPTGRRGRSGKEKFDSWCKEYEAEATGKGRQLTIEAWLSSKLRSLLLDLDQFGGLREFFFNETILTKNWFSAHLDSMRTGAGPRYTPELNVETDLWKWFAAFGRTDAWAHALDENIRLCRKAYNSLASAVSRTISDPMTPSWPADLQEDTQSLVARMETILNDCTSLTKIYDQGAYSRSLDLIKTLLKDLASIESRLVNDLESQHGVGKADSPGFRQFMAEYMVSFPTANLDDVRDAIKAFKETYDWLQSPAGSLAFTQAFILNGAAGSGKTHGVCDAAYQRFNEGMLTCVIFGHTFSGGPDPWTRLSESLGLPITLGKDGLLDCLNAAAEASGFLLVLCIDALNETRPLQYWHDRLAAVVQQFQNKPHLRLCVTCRTSYLTYCIPEGLDTPRVEHRGFEGIERYACYTFFRHYNLKPPITPTLLPELSNPLYLKLVCETLRSRGYDCLPTGFHGIAPVIRAFLDEKERQFAVEHGTSINADIIGGCLRAIARTIADSAGSALSWSRAQQVIFDARPQTRTLPVLEWLVRSDLLIEDAPLTNDPLGDDNSVRPAFDRLGDFLIATELLKRVNPERIKQSCLAGEPLHSLLKDSANVGQNSGVVSALSILVPEQNPGLELPDLIDNKSVRAEVLKITVKSFPWRDPGSFSASSTSLLSESFGLRNFLVEAMDAAVSVSWQPSAVDALWIDLLLKQRPMARRDAWWCGYLHQGYESGGPVKRLIEAAIQIELDQVDTDIAERWATILLWFTAAADRRVKDRATRAVMALLIARPEVIPNVLTRFIASDDDEVRERSLLCCYGTLIVSRNVDLIKTIANLTYKALRRDPTAFDNALIRDHIRSIVEFSRELNVLPVGCDPEFTIRPLNSEWPLRLPSDEEVKHWERLPKLARSCLDDDFYVYSMGCLGGWEHSFSKKDMGKWILQRVAREFAYEGSGCEKYDSYMLGKYGGGRGKPTWAERIGKKYQWVAMYQLASRLNDHVKRIRDSWVPEPRRTLYILVEERKFDPTLPLKISGDERDTDCWWIGSSADFRSGEKLSDAEWVAREDDLPTSEGLLAIKEQNGQRWCLLVSYPSWGRRDKDAGWDDPYRNVWVHIQGYLIPKKDAATAYECLHRRNFFGQWMPQGAEWSYGFVGEYPWATPFNTEPEEWHSRGGHGFDLPVTYQPSWCNLGIEWEYDASLPRNLYMKAPARIFFSPGDIWWDGQDGYRLINGRTLFRDPSVTENGPSALIADADDLLDRLNKLGLRLIWTLLGEKWILGGRDSSSSPRRIFSQIARLGENGSVEIGDRVFFEDYDKDTGPLLAKTKGRRGGKRNGIKSLSKK
jgi:hypothetical protein